ncbi:beta-lactamase family protein [Rhodocytophaga rosea]|uniref:Beta-lactamase family protein n=1 Tax=Rhodocytophaga rosea TaxID=2704465 RepID=A0A6C0GS36_9BACT|nr:serine hydrolase domain-containing protein [Rhodocytophaga rosea]QHT70879.1 beta-lactamase family protein [Rhodocytophaga rosea]
MPGFFFLRIIVIGLLTLIISPSFAQDLISKVDEYMQSQVNANQFSGSILMAQQGKVLVSKGYGMADQDKKITNTSATIFRLGSITKQFTATAIMQLQEKGKLNVQDPICNYFDNCPQAWKPIIIHHLLTHTSGIVNYTKLPQHKQLMSQPISVPKLIDLFINQPLEFTPGEKFDYSNSGYIVLGYIIEKVSGNTYEGYVRENLLNKIAMKHSGYEHESNDVPNRAVGYTTNEGKVEKALPIHMSYPYAAGALYSTVEDLYEWDQGLYSEKILSAKSLESMWTPISRLMGMGGSSMRLLAKSNFFMAVASMALPHPLCVFLRKWLSLLC